MRNGKNFKISTIYVIYLTLLETLEKQIATSLAAVNNPLNAYTVYDTLRFTHLIARRHLFAPQRVCTLRDYKGRAAVELVNSMCVSVSAAISGSVTAAVCYLSI